MVNVIRNVCFDNTLSLQNTYIIKGIMIKKALYYINGSHGIEPT